MSSGVLAGLRTLALADAPDATVEWLRGFLPGTEVAGH